MNNTLSSSFTERLSPALHGRLRARQKAVPAGSGNTDGNLTATPSPNTPGGIVAIANHTQNLYPLSPTLADCPCPYCTWPADPERAPRPIGQVLPDVLAEMRSLQREAGR